MLASRAVSHPSKRVPDWRVIGTKALAALGSAAVMVGAGALYARAGGTRGILCNPAVAGPYGALLAALLAPGSVFRARR
ncbi:MAG: hypothetical protein HYZ29_21770 [Myxococcales bacterium]|nr:hypothetical protein [Myxococcales bacterium]